MTPTLAEQPHTTIETRLIGSIVAAFTADPAMRWLYPKALEYQTHFPDFVRAFGGKAFEYGTADKLSGFDCAALWLPPKIHPDEDAIAAVLQRSVGEHRLAEIFEMFEQMGACHPHEPHWYLRMIGVHPREQGRGCGSALLRRALARCDRDGLPAYLESTNPLNVSLYKRFGFKPVSWIQTASSPPIIPMLRPAQ